MSHGVPAGPDIDISTPHSARIWNYWLGGKDYYPVDREAGERYKEHFPNVERNARESRYFLHRTVRFLATECGIRQFLDVGTGLPTVDNTHQVAQRAAPDARVVYVDNDPLVLAHAKALLTSSPEGETAYVDADLREPAAILRAAAGTLDLALPVAVISSDVMGHVTDTPEAYRLVRALVDGVGGGSYLMLSHGAAGDAELTAAQDEYNASGAVPYLLRTPEEIHGFFDGLDLVEPGVVPMPHWRPDIPGTEEDVPSVGWGGVARIP